MVALASREHGASTAHVARMASSRAVRNQGANASGAPAHASARAPAPPVPESEPAPKRAGAPQVPRIDFSRITGVAETQAVGHDPSSTPDPVSPSLFSVSSVPSTPSSVDAQPPVVNDACYLYKKVDAKEERAKLSEIYGLPATDAIKSRLKHTYHMMVEARQNCESMSYRAVRLLHQCGSHFQEQLVGAHACLAELQAELNWSSTQLTDAEVELRWEQEEHTADMAEVDACKAGMAVALKSEFAKLAEQR
ncbi:hypothetical protein FOA52_014845 [Chlamydomonas sp. UWO 241]|nr:hypothetical protein FOA52_014845 [Chlamydomonas sp. UWO 241]